MDVETLTRRLVDIPSITEEEEGVMLWVEEHLQQLAQQYDGVVERLHVAGNRFNVLATWGQPVVTFSTHLDTVPPFFPSREDGETIYGRGSCDAKGIAACMIVAVESLLAKGRRNLGLLFVVGEERGSAGAIAAGKVNRGARFLINGEPTENQLALGAKGALRLEVCAFGRMAHSAYPELGESAIEKLLDALERLRKLPLLTDPVLGDSTLNIGTISGGRAPNVIPDQAKAELLVRLVDDGESTFQLLKSAAGLQVELREVLRIPAMRFGELPGFPTTTVAYTSDIPELSPAWGEPFLLGPGTIHVAHTEEERVLKSDLHEAVRLYTQMAELLLDKGNNQ